MTRPRLALALSVLVYLYASPSPAEPILKPHKYEGPIPQSTLFLRVGMLGGASNDEMIQYLDGRVRPPLESNPQDFGNGLTVEIGYMHKPHPRFGIRLNGSASFVKYTSTGDLVPQVPADSLLPQLKFNRELKSELYVLEASGVYFFSDAATKEFQPYLGAGFSLGFPHETFTESRTDVDTGQPYTDPIPGRPTNASEWDVAPGVHAVGGMVYYLNDRWGISAEARVQLMEDRFEQLQAYDPDNNRFENVSFVVDYTGFYLSVGASYGF